ncbi:bacterioferritin-associated ferredoxin [Sinorhizobium fredii]
MIVCSCNVLSDHDVRSAVEAEALRSTSQVYGCLGASAQCGRCVRTIRRIMDEALGSARHPATAARGPRNPDSAAADRVRAELEQELAHGELSQRSGDIRDERLLFRAAIRIAGPVIAVAHEEVSPRPVRVRILPDPVGWLRIGAGADIGQSDRPGRRIAPSTRMLAENALPPVKAVAEIGEIRNHRRARGPNTCEGTSCAIHR